MHFFTLCWKVLKSKSQNTLKTRHNSLFRFKSRVRTLCEVPSFVLLLFAFIPIDGTLIRTKQVLSVFVAVVHMYVHVIFTCIKPDANPLEH